MSAFIQGGGDVFGPAGATDGNLVVFDGTTGKIIKDGKYRPAGLMFVNVDNSLVNVGATPVVLTWAMPAGMMTRNGDSLRITSEFNTAANANGKSFNISLGGEAVYTSTGAFNNLAFRIICHVVRTAATTQVYLREQLSATLATAGTAVILAPIAGTQVMANQLNVSVTLSGITTGDIRNYLLMIEFLPAP